MFRRQRRRSNGERRGNRLIGKRRESRRDARQRRKDRVFTTRERKRAATVIVPVRRRVAGGFAAAENCERAESYLRRGDRMRSDRKSEKENLQRNRVRRNERNRRAERPWHHRMLAPPTPQCPGARPAVAMAAPRTTAREHAPGVRAIALSLRTRPKGLAGCRAIDRKRSRHHRCETIFPRSCIWSHQ
jgi:hypothetical protein